MSPRREREITTPICDLDALFKSRVERHKKRLKLQASGEAMTPDDRLGRAVSAAEDNLSMMQFHSKDFGDFIRTLFKEHNGTILLRHPKHKATIFQLEMLDGPRIRIISLPSKLASFETRLKLARRLRDPERAIDTLFELFGPPAD